MYFPRKILKPEVDVNTYYYYCRCCCCRWWHLLLGLLVLRPSISSLLQSATSVITKCDSFFYYKVRWSVITKCDSFFITKCDRYYKVRRLLQSATVQGRRVRRIPNALLLLFWSQWSMISSIFSVTKEIRRQSVSWPLKRQQNQPDQVCFVAVLLLLNCRHQPDIYILCLKHFLCLNYIFLSWFQSFAWFRTVFGYGTVS